MPRALGACRSRNGEHLVLATRDGLEFREGTRGSAALQGDAPTLAFPSKEILRPLGLDPSIEWEADDEPFELEQMQVSDDGMRVVLSCYRQGILLASRHENEPDWRLLWPDQRDEYCGWGGDPDEPRYAGDMTHVAISRDGNRLAFGCQDSSHLLWSIEDGQLVPHAQIGPASEYPHFACFDDEGQRVALNSCHFYSGATSSYKWDAAKGELEPYEDEEAVPVIDDGLRVYGGAWLDHGVVQGLVGPDAKAPGAFLLAGAGIMRLVGADGGLGFVQGFGSSASSVDFCAESRRFAVASYSGMVTVYASDEAEEPGRVDGVDARREVYRWSLWDNLEAPVRWG